MPYIQPRRRTQLNLWAAGEGDYPPPWEPGELNYLFTQLIEEYRRGQGDSYSTFNDIIGALEGAKQEFYRRVVAPYEDRKALDNGDVYQTPRS